MGNHDALAWQIRIPALELAVLYNEVFIGVQVALEAYRLVGGSILLVPHGQCVVGARLRGDVVNLSHERFLVGTIACRRIGVIIIGPPTHDVPIAQADVTVTN